MARHIREILEMTEGPEKAKVPRRLAAILAADIAGYSALMGADEADTVRNLMAHQAVVLPIVTEHGGRTLSGMRGDHDLNEIVGPFAGSRGLRAHVLVGKWVGGLAARSNIRYAASSAWPADHAHP